MWSPPLEEGEEELAGVVEALCLKVLGIDYRNLKTPRRTESNRHICRVPHDDIMPFVVTVSQIIANMEMQMVE